ncbi:hypothetical protein [Nocardioides marmoribigeumensis]|uniref:Metal-dependent hydrolase n=1 Tax=Nocardioides marmoribigeumensis TaxID=433649 RepID=A0ABU2BPX9_9ACTN|nr:hypothetical protein [Nocardioides marmoribigeumensis]MDR7360675.1 hypothetical protein [Nocardioides marmoribigeumensis]
MLVTNHVLSGAVVAALCPGPVSAFTAGVVSHFLLDTVPHWGDVEFDEMVPIGVRDGLVGLAAMTLVHGATPPGRRLRVLAGMSGAAFPDLDKPALLFFGRSPFPRAWDDFHVSIQRESRDRMTQEFLVGGAFLAAALVAVRRR